MRICRPTAAIVTQAAVFALAHTALGDLTALGDNPVAYNATATLDVFIAGLGYGYLVVETASFVPAVALHAAGNLVTELASPTPALGAVTAGLFAVVVAVGVAVAATTQAHELAHTTTPKPNWLTRQLAALGAPIQRRLGHQPALARLTTWIDPARSEHDPDPA